MPLQPPVQVHVLGFHDPPWLMQSCCWLGSHVGGGGEQVHVLVFHTFPLLVHVACPRGSGQVTMLEQLELLATETARQNSRSFWLEMEEHCVESCRAIPRHRARLSASATLLQLGELVLLLEAP